MKWSLSSANEALCSNSSVDISQLQPSELLFFLEAVIRSRRHYSSSGTILRSCAAQIERMTSEELAGLCRVLELSRVAEKEALTRKLSAQLLLSFSRDLSRIRTAHDLLAAFRLFLANTESVEEQTHYHSLGEEMKHHAMSLLGTFSPEDLSQLMKLLDQWGHGAGFMPRIIVSSATASINSFSNIQKVAFCALSADPVFCAKTAEGAVALVLEDAYPKEPLCILLTALARARVFSKALLLAASASILKSHSITLTTKECRQLLAVLFVFNVQDNALMSCILKIVIPRQMPLAATIDVVRSCLGLGVVPEKLLRRVMAVTPGGKQLDQYRCIGREGS